MTEQQSFSLVSDKSADASAFAESKRPDRICLVHPQASDASDSHNFARHLALLLNVPGQSVTCLLHYEAATSEKTSALIEQLERAKSNLEYLPKPSSERTEGTLDQIRAYELFKWLKERQFDLVHLPDRFGVGYYTLLAKHQGLYFQHTVFCVNIQGPSAWVRYGDAIQIRDPKELIVDFMERETLALADVAICPSESMLRWIQEQQWRLPKSTVVQQNPFALVALLRGSVTKKDSPTPAHPSPAKISEIVFYEDLTRRKGLELACNVVDRLSEVQRSPVKITFLGTKGQIDGAPSDLYLNERAKSWALPWQIVDTLTDAHAADYLLGENRLTVIPGVQTISPYMVHNCSQNGISFLCSSVEGISELLDPEDIKRITFEPSPDQLYTKLLDALAAPPAPVRAAVDIAANGKHWQDWHRITLGTARHNTTPPQGGASLLPLVTVCMPHFNRPTLLRQAIASIKAQDYPHIEVIVVDDGSTDPLARKTLAEIEGELADRGWSLLRQAHSSVGAARNLAARHARGDYLLLMDDDNCAKPHEISTLVRVALHTKADILTSFIDLFSGTEAPLPEHQPDMTRILLGPALAAGMFENVYGDTNALIRKDAFINIGGHIEDAETRYEDCEFYAKAVLKGLRFEVIPEALFWYRQSGVRRTTSLPRYPSYLKMLRPYIAEVHPDLHGIFYAAQGMYLHNRDLGSLIDTLRKDLTSYQELQQKHQAFCAEVDEKLSARRGAIRQFQATVAELKQTLEEQGQVLDKKRAAGQRLDKQCSDLQIALQQRDITCREMEARIRDLDHQLWEARTQLESMNTSTSWRVTRPLRSLREALKRNGK
jgi:O-antigen biosynthesis protein